MRGAWYAVEQAGYLLEDAAELFGRRRFSSCLVFSIYSLEELGRAKVYLETRKRVLNSEIITVEFLKERCRRHELKLAEARIPVTAVAVTFAEPLAPGSEKEAKLVAHLECMRQLLESQAPGRAHGGRFRALYVDPSDDARQWNRPVKVTKEEAEEWLDAARFRYCMDRDEIVNPVEDAGLLRALKNFETRPLLPEIDYDPFAGLE